ncbi:MAG: inorganic phosphate transporter [Pyrinomonadaceae bacterium]|nr:inorganic phosphate transporter [Pyrinomonadaceae bacterium]
METFYLIVVVVLFFLAISDLIVGVSNDAVNFLNSAVGSKAAGFKIILFVAALGVLVGCTFSTGMMEVARKGIFHPEYFFFSEIILLFLAVMITDVILLDAFNSFGMPTSTTVSIVFELLGAATAFAVIKTYTAPNGLEMGNYINSDKALVIIAGILLSVVVAFTAGVIAQYLTRLLFSFDYKNSFKYFGGVWGGFAIAAMTYFMIVKGAKGASFMSGATKDAINENTWYIIGVSFLVWTVILSMFTLFTKVNILRLIVLIGTFSLAMAFAGNDLVNFIGVPLAGYNSYEIWSLSGTAADNFLMTDLAGKVPTPTYLLLFAGIVMVITLFWSAKARSVVKTSLDLGRQSDGYERFTSYAASRSLVRTFSRVAISVNNSLPTGLKQAVIRRFDERPFISKQASLGLEAPSFDMIRAATTLVVASILISIGTNFKLPLSTTYVTFMVFMGTSLADGAWGRESAVYRVSGVLSVVGGWFFTAFSAFSAAFVIAVVFYFGGAYAVLPVLVVAGIVMFRTHRHHGKRIEDQRALERSIADGDLTKGDVLEICGKRVKNALTAFAKMIDDSLEGLSGEDLNLLNLTYKDFLKLNKRTRRRKNSVNFILDKMEESDFETAHFYILITDYLDEMANHVYNIVKPSLDHVDNNHKPLLPVQIEELVSVAKDLKGWMVSTIAVYQDFDAELAKQLRDEMGSFKKRLKSIRKGQIKRIKNREIGTRNSQLYFNHLGELRDLAIFTNRLVRICEDLIIDSNEEETGGGEE